MKKTIAFLMMMTATVLFAAPAGVRPTANQPRRVLGGARSEATAAQESAGDAAAAVSGGQLNFAAAPLDLVLDAYSELLGKTCVKDPNVPAVTITLKSYKGQVLTNEDKIRLIELALSMNGIHVDPLDEKTVRVLPRQNAIQHAIPIYLNPEEKLTDSGRVVAYMIRFTNISAQEEAQKALEGFKSDKGSLMVFERMNSILVTDTERNVMRMREIARAIDVATPVLENVFVRQIENASAEEIKTALEAIVQESQKELEANGKGSQAAQTATQPQRPMSRLNGLRGRGREQAPEPQPQASSFVTSISDADRGMIRGKVLIIADERSNKLVIITQQANMDFFDKVIKHLDVPTTPDTQVKVYRLKYAEAEEVSDMINDLIGNSSASNSKGQNQNPTSKSGTGGNLTSGSTQAAKAKQPANRKSGEAKAGELTKDNTVVLADKRINGLVVMTDKELVPTIEQIIESMDVKLSQVLIETVIIEVGLGDDLKTGVDWVQNGRFRESGTKQRENELGQKLFYTERTKKLIGTGEDVPDVSSETSILSDIVPEGFSRVWKDDNYEYTDKASSVGVFDQVLNVVKDGLVSGSAGYSQMLGGGANGGAQAADFVTGVASNLFGSSINYIFKSDKLNLSAIIQASKGDSHTKYLASPIVMTVDNKEASVEATEMRYLFKGYQYSGSSMYGSAVPDYEQKDLGITLKMTPKINPNGTIMLEVEAEYSQPLGTQSIAGPDGKYFNAENTVTRKMSADILLENMQTAVLGGLTQTSYSEAESGIPILKDIPFIGKWLFGSVSQSESRKELLIFMQPYVLDDGEATQAEALRRKKTFSIARPWEDHGWSLSELADPISKAEQFRRLKEEWKKQDEERKTKLAIEAEKVKRAKALENMSREERDFWLEMHKDELEEERREEFEQKMLDDESQGELRKLASEVRQRKLNEANAAIRKADEEFARDNERGQLEAEKNGEMPSDGDAEVVEPDEAEAAAAEEAQ